MRNKSIYLILIFLISLSCTESEDTEALKIRSLSYTNNSTTLKVGEGFVSDTPEVDGGGTLTFSIADVSVNDFEGISIDETTGVITVAEDNTLKGDISYVIDIAVSNQEVTEVFQNVFMIKVIALDLPRNLIYAVDSISVPLATDTSSVIPTIDGLSPVSFTLENETELPEFLSVNEGTGVINVNGETSEVGNYKISLLVVNDDGATSFEAAYTVKILAPEAIATFSYEFNTNGPLTIDFTNTSQNAVSHAWDFGDGSTSIEENPSHTYSTAGEYEVVLTATNSDGFDNQYTETIYVNDLTGTYLVTNSWCSPSFTVEITRNADGTYHLPRADGGALSLCTTNDNLLNSGNIREQSGEILPTGDLEFGSANSTYDIGDISGGTWDAEEGVLTMRHSQNFTSNWPSEWTSTYVRQ